MDVVIKITRHRFAAAADAACNHPEGYLREVPVIPAGDVPGPDEPTAVMMCDRCALCVGYVA